jgi:hypothetical protein
MFVFSPQTMDQIGSERFDQFEKKCIDFLRDQFPELMAIEGSLQELEAVRSGIQLAGFRGFSDEVDIAQFLYLRQLLGSGFDASDNPVGKCLNDLSLPASERMDRAMDLLVTILDTPSRGAV